MLVQPVAVLLLFYFNVSHELQDSGNIISLVTDFIKIQDTSTKLTAYLCWDNNDLIQFWSELSENNIVANFPDPANQILSYSLPDEHQMFLMDVDCEGSNEILKQAEKLNLFNLRFRWLFIGNKTYLDHFYFGVGSQIYLIENYNEHIQIKSIYKFTRTSPEFQHNYISTWSKNNATFLDYHPLFISKNRSDLMGQNLNITYVITNPDSLNHLWDYRNKHIDAIFKLNFVLVEHLKTFMNATAKLTHKNSWGYRNKTTLLYDGLMGDLQNGRADLGGTPSFFTADRIDIVDYMAATTPTYMKFIFRAPPLSYITNVYTLPFHTYVWYVCFLMIGVMFLVLYAIVKWEWKDADFQASIENKHRALQPNAFEVFMLEIGAITQQGADGEPQSGAGRIATFFAFLILMFLYNAYSANIVALLQSTTDSIRTLDDLLTTRVKLGVEDIVYAHYYFENAQEPLRKRIYEQKVAPKGQKPNFMTIDEGIKRMRNEFFAFHVEVSNGYKVVIDTFQENEKCGLKEIEYVNLIVPYLSCAKNSTYRELFKVGMRKLQESGIQSREIQRIYTKKPVCHTKGSNFGSVGLIDVYSGFLIFGVGLAASFTVLILEILLKMYVIRKTGEVFNVSAGVAPKLLSNVVTPEREQIGADNFSRYRNFEFLD